MKKSVKPFLSVSAFERIKLAAYTDDISHPCRVLQEEIAGGFDINEARGDGETLLSDACISAACSPEWVQHLLGLGADPNKKNAMGTSPALSASQAEDWVEEKLALLAAAGASLDESNNAGTTPFACLVHKLSLASREEAKAKILRQLMCLLDLGVDPNGIQEEYGGSMVHLVCYRLAKEDFSSCAVALLAKMEGKGVDFNARNQDGCTPLMLAVNSDHFEVALWLIGRNVDMDAVDKHGRSALDWCHQDFRPLFESMKMQADVPQVQQVASPRRP